MLSVTSMMLDANTRVLESVRFGLGTALTPLRYLAYAPYGVTGVLGGWFENRESLAQHNAELEAQLLAMTQKTQLYEALITENARLRELLGSRQTLEQDVIVAELLQIVPAPDTHRIVIDKGSTDGIGIGQAVIDAEGLFGQIIDVAAYSSEVLLVTDVSHAVPVEIVRNGFRAIAGGTSDFGRLELEYVPVTADIREGDLVVSSGLGGRFPRGYPVGLVQSLVVDPRNPFAQVVVRPSALLDRSRHVLVVFERGEDG